MRSRFAARACRLAAVASSRCRLRFSRLEYANSFEAGDRLAGWSRADSNIGPDSVTNAVYLYAASGCTTGVVSHVADGTARNVNYTWTDDYRLSGVSVNGAAVAEYAYDVLGNLVAVANGEESFEILVDGGHSLADVAADGSTLRVYMRAPGVDNWLGFVDMTGAAPVPYYYVTDHLGSVLAVVDANGNVVERYEYDAWGKVLSVTDAEGNALTRSAIGNRILWQAREYSWTTGLYYFRNRWYDPTIGRWISKDPIGIQGGINLYEFCEGNPIMDVDPDGCSFLPVAIDKLGKVNRTLNPYLSGCWFWHHTVRELLNDPLPETPPEGEDGWTELPPNKSIFHDNGDECPERKFVHRDGREAVYDGKTKRLITDSVYKGTYNFINPGDKDDRFVVRHLKNLGHGLYDVLPYIIMGN